MTIKLFQIDAFTSHLFGGNPAAVCPLENWLDEDLMQKIAMENNLAETAFFVLKNNRYEIRWFTPTVEVDLCGHATLAAAYVLYFELNVKVDKLRFWSHRSGELIVTRSEGRITLNFPMDKLEQLPLTDISPYGIGENPIEVYKGKTDIMLVYKDEEVIRHMKPDLLKLKIWDVRGVIVTAPGKVADFVSRFFAPQSGIDEDPVTGSAHTSLIPYWSARFGKTSLTAKQLSARGGDLFCKDLGERVEISGECKLYMKGEINL